MRADDLFAEFSLMDAPAPEPVGNEREVVPRDGATAAAFFRCETLGCSMRGSACANNWSMAENGATNRPSCRGCAAGRARYRLIGNLGVAEAMPAQALAPTSRRVEKCTTCGMRKTDKKHTPALCQRVAASTAAAVNATSARARNVERADAARRAKAAKEADAARAAKRAEKEKRDAEKAEAAAKARAETALLREERKAEMRAAIEAQEKADREKRAAKLAAKSLSDAEKARIKAERKRQAAVEDRIRKAIAAGRDPVGLRATVPASEREGVTCRRAGVTCSNPASMWAGGPYCRRCMRSTGAYLRERLYRQATSDELLAMLVDPTWTGRKIIEWDPVDFEAMTDAEIANKYQTTRNTVAAARRRRFKTLMRKAHAPVRVDWDSQPLGIDSDREIATRLGVSFTSVAEARRRRGIPHAPPKSKATGIDYSTIDWSAQPLGRVTDREIAQVLGVSRTLVRLTRMRLGIPPHTPGQATTTIDVDWTTVGLGVRLDTEIAAELGVSHATVGIHRRLMGIPKAPTPEERIDWSGVDFATMTNEQIIDALGVSRVSVVRARHRRGIPDPTGTGDPRWQTVDWEHLHDAEIARQMKCSRRTAANRRAEIGRPMLMSARRCSPRVTPEQAEANYAKQRAQAALMREKAAAARERKRLEREAERAAQSGGGAP